MRIGNIRTLMGAFLSVAVLLTAARSPAQQVSNQKIRDRYERHTKGGNFDEFVRRLNSEDPAERLDAVKSLEESKDPKAAEYLVQALGDSDLRVQAKAIDALGNLRAREATPVLIQQLFLRNTQPTVKQRLLASLGKIGDTGAAPAIVEFMQRDLDPTTQGTAIFALGEIGAPESLPALEEVETTTEDPTLRRLASEAASKVRYHQALLQTEAKEPQATFLKDNEPPAPQ